MEELLLIKKGWKGKIASILESFCVKVNLMQTKKVLAVTKDIASYQKKNSPLINSFVYPNGISTDMITPLKDKRKKDEINIVFVCGTFSSWHGLDLLLNSALENIQKLDHYL